MGQMSRRLRTALLSLRDLLVSAGPLALLGAGLVDELLLYVAPVVLGDKARPLFAGLDIASMAQSLRMSIVDQRQLGVDLRLRMRPATA